MEKYSNYVKYDFNHFFDKDMNTTKQIYVPFIPDEIRLVNMVATDKVAPTNAALRLNTDLVDTGILFFTSNEMIQLSRTVYFKNIRSINGTYNFNLTAADGSTITNAALTQTYFMFTLYFIKY
jgi:hypothetical protein